MKSPSTRKLNRVVANSLPEILLLREIRNDCREFMTRDTHRITLAEQRSWFHLTYEPSFPLSMMAVLFYDGKQPAGYGLLRRSRGRVWLSGGLITEKRGKGFGRDLFDQLILLATFTYPNLPIYLEVRRDNDRSRVLYEKLGFHKVLTRGKVLVMRL